MSDYQFNLEYLWGLTTLSMNELDHLKAGAQTDLRKTRELSSVLKDHIFKTNNLPTAFPYMSIWTALRKENKKSIDHLSAFALELNLLSMELQTLSPSSLNNVDIVKSSLLNMSRTFKAAYETSRDYCAA